MSRVKKVTILGASLGGLSTGIALLKNSIEVVLIDAASFPTLKTCGEFLSYEAVEMLKTLGITPNREIKEIHFHHEEQTIVSTLPIACASMPRLTLEKTLLEHFIALGGTTILGTKVHHIVPGPPFQLHLDKGEVAQTDHLVIATGRFQGAPPTQTPIYRGIKNHYLMASPPEALQMFFFKDGYCGISPIDHKTAVLSCLLKEKALESYGGDTESFIKDLISKTPRLQASLRQAKPLLTEHLVTPVGNFGCKNLPNWPQSYFVGDAAATVAPIIGQGITIALTAGIMAAEYIKTGSYKEYQKAWKKRYRSRIQISSLLHSLALSPFLFKNLYPLLEKHPKILHTLFNRTRG